MSSSPRFSADSRCPPALLVAGLAAGIAAGLALSACGAASAAPHKSTTTTGAGQVDSAPMPTMPTRPTVRLAPHHRRARPRMAAKLPPGTLPPPSPGFEAGRVTIFGDSVTIDAAPDLVADIKGADVQANVGEQWYQGVAMAQALKAEGRLGSVVVIALGTNGPLTSADIASMMQVLAGCSRVVLVTNHVPDYWQNPNNALLEHAAATYKNVVVANWEALAAANPSWFYSDGTHMPIGGAGAQAFAHLVASEI